jgi:hypothetical protein
MRSCRPWRPRFQHRRPWPCCMGWVENCPPTLLRPHSATSSHRSFQGKCVAHRPALLVTTTGRRQHTRARTLKVLGQRTGPRHRERGGEAEQSTYFVHSLCRHSIAAALGPAQSTEAPPSLPPRPTPHALVLQAAVQVGGWTRTCIEGIVGSASAKTCSFGVLGRAAVDGLVVGHCIGARMNGSQLQSIHHRARWPGPRGTAKRKELAE